MRMARRDVDGCETQPRPVEAHLRKAITERDTSSDLRVLVASLSGSGLTRSTRTGH